MNTIKRTFSMLAFAAFVLCGVRVAQGSEHLMDAYKKYTREGKAAAAKAGDDTKAKCTNHCFGGASSSNGLNYSGTAFGGINVGGMRVGNVIVGGVNVGGFNVGGIPAGPMFK